MVQCVHVKFNKKITLYRFQRSSNARRKKNFFTANDGTPARQ